MRAEARASARAAFPLLCLTVAACIGLQLTLDAGGEAAQLVTDLFSQMLTGAAVICIVIATSLYAATRDRRPWKDSTALDPILWAGALFPAVMLGGLLVHGLRLMPELRATGGDLRIKVVAQRLQWRVTCHIHGRPPILSANELRMPAGATVQVELGSPDVIHSFWIPSLAGKTDMIPSRTARQMLKPTRPGLYRGACAEFCGSSHALMALTAVVLKPAEFQRWLLTEAGPATPATATGEAVFHANGCGACHTVRGTQAAGTVSRTSHLSSRNSIGAGILANTPGDIAHFVAHTGKLKPGVRMPAYAMLPPADLTTLATWLDGLR